MLRLLRTSSSWRSISMNNTLPNSSPASSISSRTISFVPTPTPPQKRTILAKLKSTTDSCDDVLRKIEKEGRFQISRPDLNRWIALFEKRGQIQKSIEIDSFKEWKYIGLMKTYKPCFGRTNVGDPLPTSILASSNSSTSSSTDANFFGKDSLKNAAAIIAPSSVNLTRYKGLFGSGVVFSEQGLIITTAHTVVDVEKLQVSPVYHAQRKEVMITTSLGQTFVGAVADYDLDYDLALVKIESPVSLSPAKFGTSSLLAVGDFVLSVGNPILYATTFSMGIISCLKRPQHDLRLEGKCEVYLQTDCCLREGSSGGALVNLEGEVIGLNCGHGVGVGFAIPIGTVLKVMKERRWLCED